jgi:hypothetical protein
METASDVAAALPLTIALGVGLAVCLAGVVFTSLATRIVGTQLRRWKILEDGGNHGRSITPGIRKPTPDPFRGPLALTGAILGLCLAPCGASFVVLSIYERNVDHAVAFGAITAFLIAHSVWVIMHSQTSRHRPR